MKGDLMFVVKEESNPITDATQGIDGLKIDHVAIFHHTDSTDYALEAISKGVVLTPLAKFLERTKGKEGKPLVCCWKSNCRLRYERFYETSIKLFG